MKHCEINGKMQIQIGWKNLKSFFVCDFKTEKENRYPNFAKRGLLSSSSTKRDSKCEKKFFSFYQRKIKVFAVYI